MKKAVEVNTIIFIDLSSLGKHSLALGSRGAKRKDFRGIMGQAKEKKLYGNLKIYSLVQHTH